MSQKNIESKAFGAFSSEITLIYFTIIFDKFQLNNTRFIKIVGMALRLSRLSENTFAVLKL